MCLFKLFFSEAFFRCMQNRQKRIGTIFKESNSLGKGVICEMINFWKQLNLNDIRSTYACILTSNNHQSRLMIEGKSDFVGVICRKRSIPKIDKIGKPQFLVLVKV